MSDAVLYIDRHHSPSDLDAQLGADDCPVRFIHVDHGQEHVEADTNLVKIARSDDDARELIATLANNGFYTYMSKDNATRFVNEKSLGKLWIKLASGEYIRHANGIVYSYADQLGPGVPKRLLVVFSSISGNINTPSLMRYFEQNFRSIQKYLPPDTAVLRIADLGGVVGAFYLNTTHLPNNEDNIQQVIDDVRRKHGIAHESVVLYGASKGGTGALYHAVKGHYRCVSVDPIVDDEHYIRRYNDAHFTGNGIFPEPKKLVFERMMKEIASQAETPRSAPVRWSVICSGNSPQYKYIARTLITGANSRISFYDSRNPLIKDHPQVGQNTINTATALMNFHLYAIPVAAGLHVID